MPSSTKYFGLGYFDFGDPFGSDFAEAVEIERWVFLDKQLYGMMSIFGNGVVSGWEVEQDGAFGVKITSGHGHINFVASRTNYAASLEGFAPGTTSYIYARISATTGYTEAVDFIISNNSGLLGANFLLISKVTTSSTSIIEIDDSVRTEIGFLEIIKAAIREHKHRGGSLHPSKINLASEVKGQLPSFRIADFDAEKVSTGTFDLSRIPLLDHSDLTNTGLLTHPQLDSFVKNLQADNVELFGEIMTSNFIQFVIGMKLLYDDPDSAFYDSSKVFDETFPNEFVVIPGVTPNSFIDFDNSTATINLESHYIRGVPPNVGTSFYVNYDTALAWRSAYLLDDLAISGNTVLLAYSDSDELSVLKIEDFEGATSPGSVISDGQMWTHEVVELDDAAQIVAHSSATNVYEGFYAGEVTNQQSFRSQFVKEFSYGQDWSTYDRFVIGVKCMDQIHGPVRMYLVSGSGDQSDDYTLLATSEVTENSDTLANDYELRVIDLSTISFRSNVKKIVIYTDDLTNPFRFFIDAITVQRAVLLPEEGTMKIRYSSPTQVTFSSIEWTSTEPAGTEVRVRVKAASSTALLGRSEYTDYLSSGDLVNLEGSDLEVEVTFEPDADRLNSPVLSSLRLLITTEAEINGFAINTLDEWSRGSTGNVEIDNSGTLSLEEPIYVDSHYYCLGNAVNQSRQVFETSGYYTEVELAVFGNQTPISPNQVFKTIEDGETSAGLARLFDPRSVVRQHDRTFVVADTYNDRVLQLDEDGTLIAGFGSVNYEHSSKLFPISACVDTRTGILYIVWTKKINFATVDVSKITVQTSNEQIRMVQDSDKIMGVTMDELSSVNSEGQILPIHLTAQNAAVVSQMTSDAFVLVGEAALSSGIDTDSYFYRSVGTSLGIPLFVGKFAYIDGVFSPTFADKTEDDTFLVANGTVGIKEYDFPTDVDESISQNANVSSIIEVDEDNAVIFSSDIMEFSPFVPGRVERISSTSLLVGGLKKGGSEGTPSATLDFRTISGTPENRATQKQVLDEVFFPSTDPYVGAVMVYNQDAQTATFQYTSPEGVVVSDVDLDPIDGTYVVAESSFARSGRIIKLDAAGNIVFSFGEGAYGVINDVNVQLDGSFIIST